MSRGMPAPRITALLLASVLLAPCAAGSLSAQTRLEGRVLDDVTQQPLASARVFLLNRYNKVADYTTTDEEGRFGFTRRNDGWFRVEVSAVGYLRATSPPVWMVQNRAFAGLEIRLARNAVLLAPLEIIALAPPTTSHVLEAVAHRRTRGFGIQITRQQIEERNPQRLSDILMELPGVYAQRRGSGTSGRIITMGRSLPGVGGGACPVQIFLDGVLATRDVTGGGADVFVDDLASPLDIEAVEVFRGLGSIPPEFLTPNARCGVIAIWTKRSLEGLP